LQNIKSTYKISRERNTAVDIDEPTEETNLAALGNRFVTGYPKTFTTESGRIFIVGLKVPDHQIPHEVRASIEPNESLIEISLVRRKRFDEMEF
jgi:hypothetical protein